MSNTTYAFAVTAKIDSDTYVEDRGYLRTVSRGDSDFAAVDGEFGTMLSAGQSAVRGENGTWEVRDGFVAKEAYDAAETHALRAKRDKMLADTDFLVMPDYPIGEDYKAEIEAYRQALRDIPQQDGWPWVVIWPEKPEKG